MYLWANDFTAWRRLALLLAAAAVSTPVFGQNPGTDSRDEDVQLDEIIVTATRRATRTRDVPFSVQVLSADALRRTLAYDFADYAGYVPGLSFTHGSNGEKPVVRGVTTDQWIDLNPTVALYLDETPVTHHGGNVGPPYSTNPQLVDIDRIEVLRGPQGTLFGADAMGGAIRILTKEPVFRPEGFVEAAVTTLRDGDVGYRLQAMTNVVPSTDRMALRLVAYSNESGGYIDKPGDSDANNSRVTGGRAAATLRLTDAVTLKLRAMHQRQRQRNPNSETPATPRQIDSLPEPRADEWTSLSATLDWQPGPVLLTANSSFVDRRQDTTADVSPFLTIFFGIDNPLSVVNRLDSVEHTQELRLTSEPGSRLDWLVGAFFQDGDVNTNQDFPSPGFDALTGGMASMFGPPDNLFVRREEHRKRQFALYADTFLHLNDAWSVGVGLRWFDIKRRFVANNQGLLFVAGSVQDAGSASETGSTPRFSARYRPSDEMTFYVTVAEGFRPGNVNPPEGSTEPACVAELQSLGRTEFPTSYDADRLWNYETGIKGRWWDGRLALDAALYRIDWQDLQTTRLMQCGIGFVENAGDARSEGVELQLDAVSLNDTQLSLGIAWVDARLRDDVPNLGGASGDRLPGVPEFTAHLGIGRDLDVRGTPIRVQLNHRYSGSSWSGFDTTSSEKLGTVQSTDLRLGLVWKEWSATFFANNLFDNRGDLFTQNNILGSLVVTQRPRQFGISLRRDFQ